MASPPRGRSKKRNSPSPSPSSNAPPSATLSSPINPTPPPRKQTRSVTPTPTRRSARLAATTTTATTTSPTPALHTPTPTSPTTSPFLSTEQEQFYLPPSSPPGPPPPTPTAQVRRLNEALRESWLANNPQRVQFRDYPMASTQRFKRREPVNRVAPGNNNLITWPRGSLRQSAKFVGRGEGVVYELRVRAGEVGALPREVGASGKDRMDASESRAPHEEGAEKS